MEGMTKFQCIGTSMNHTQNPLKLFHDVRLQENPQGVCDFSALGVTT